MDTLVWIGVVLFAMLGVALSALAITPITPRKEFVCPHVYPFGQDPLCARYGCPDDPNWIGDRR